MATTKADLSFLNQPATSVAPLLLGWRLVHDTPAGEISGMIVETEAYLGLDDPASHAFRGQTPRNAVMFGPPGHLYVYFTYGIHYCCNIVTGPDNQPSAVLIRALEPLTGLELMIARRGTDILTKLTSGPGLVTQALGLNMAMNGHDLLTKPLQLLPYKKPARPSESYGERMDNFVASPRVGIRSATEKLWRFSIKDNPYVSRPKPKTKI